MPSSRSIDTVIPRAPFTGPLQCHDGRRKRGWLRGLDSNQDNQLQRLACYQLHYPGKEERSSVLRPYFCAISVALPLYSRGRIASWTCFMLTTL